MTLPVTVPVPAHADVMGDGKFIALTDFGRVALAHGAPADIAAELQGGRGNLVAMIVEPRARTRGGSEWDGQEDAFRAAVRAYARHLGRRRPDPRRSGAPAHVVFDPGRDNQSYQAARDA